MSASPSASPTGAGIRGVVRDSRGAAVEGAYLAIAHETEGIIIYSGGRYLTVTARRPDQLPGRGSLPGATTGEAMTAKDGSFAFENLADGAFTLVAAHPQRGVAIVADLRSADRAPLAVTLDDPAWLTATLKNIDFDPSWYVVNLDGESPWANVQLALRMERTSASEEFTAGPVPRGCTWTITALARNAARSFTIPLVQASVAIEPGTANRVSIDAAAGGAIRGRVMNAAGAPLADVGIIARPKSDQHSARSAFTDADGRYAIPGLSAGEYELRAVRHVLRREIGCGEGPLDVEFATSFNHAGESAQTVDLTIDALVRTPQVGDEAPPFAARSVEGPEVVLGQHRGRVVLLDFWATWCVLCLSDMKHLAALHREREAHGDLQIISISLDRDPRVVERFLRRQDLPWPQLVLGPADVNPIARLYNAMSTPTIVLIDREGRIAARHVPGDHVREQVMKLLESSGTRGQ